MPKLRKDDVADIDLDEMEEAEYTDQDWSDYDGEIPPVGTELRGYIKKMWWTRTSQTDNPMLVALFEASDNEDDLEEYNGLPVWERAVLTPGAKFRWAPLLETFGLSIRDVLNKTFVEDEEDSMGAPIQKIASFVPGSDDSWCRIITARHKYDGSWQADVKKWLPWEDEDEEPEPEPEPARGRASRTAAPARSRRAEPEPEPEEDEDEPEAAGEAPGRSRKASAPARGGKAAAATSGRSSRTKPAPAGRGRRAAAATEEEDEPPF